MRFRRVILVPAALVAGLGLAVPAADAKPPTPTSGANCTLPASDADALAT